MKSLFNKYKGIIVFFVLLFLYIFIDALNSGNTGLDDENRRGVYILLILMVVWNTLSLLTQPNKYNIHNPIINCMCYITVWVLLCGLLNGVTWVLFVHLFLSIWWITTYYYFSRYSLNHDGSMDFIISLFVIAYVIYVPLSFYAQANIAINRMQEHIVLNYAYNIISFVPLILLVANSKIRKILLFSVVIMLLISFKRGPLIIFPAMLLVYTITPGNQQSRWPLAKVFFYSIFGGILITVANNISDGYLFSRFSRMELADGSNRAEMWSIAWDDIRNRDILTFLIGKGSGSSIELLTSGCHNEWLEFLFSFGIIGVILYFAFGISLIKRLNKLIRNKSEYACIYSTLVVFFWLVGLFSGFYFVHSSFYFFASLGLLESLIHKEESL